MREILLVKFPDYDYALCSVLGLWTTVEEQGQLQPWKISLSILLHKNALVPFLSYNAVSAELVHLSFLPSPPPNFWMWALKLISVLQLARLVFSLSSTASNTVGRWLSGFQQSHCACFVPFIRWLVWKSVVVYLNAPIEEWNKNAVCMYRTKIWGKNWESLLHCKLFFFCLFWYLFGPVWLIYLRCP